MIAYFAVKGKEVIPLKFIGIQHFGETKIELFNVMKPLINDKESFSHPIESTVSRETIENLGWEIR